MVANLNVVVIYHGILNLENVGTVVIYCGILITLAHLQVSPQHTLVDHLTMLLILPLNSRLGIKAQITKRLSWQDTFAPSNPHS